MKRVILKGYGKTDPAYLTWVQELRRYLPTEFRDVSDEDLIQAYSMWSEDFYCAGWLIPSRETAREFVKNSELVEVDGGKVRMVMYGALAGALAVGGLLLVFSRGLLSWWGGLF